MKGTIPIIIAMILVFSIILSSLYFITTMSIRSATTSLPYSTLYWLRLDNELNNLAYIALKYGSEAADEEFEKIYNNQVQSVSDISELNYAVRVARQAANQVMANKVNEIINNWIRLKEREGIVIKVKNLSSAYVVDFGYGYSNVYFDFVIITKTGESREFSRNYTAFYSITLKKTNVNDLNNFIAYIGAILERLGLNIVPDVNLTLVFSARAYLDFNGERYYYILDKENSMAIINSFVSILSIFDESISSAEYIPVGIYYYGDGYTEIAYRVKYDDLTVLGALIGLLSELFLGEQYIGVTSAIDIDGFKARSAILISS